MMGFNKFDELFSDHFEDVQTAYIAALYIKGQEGNDDFLNDFVETKKADYVNFCGLEDLRIFIWKDYAIAIINEYEAEVVLEDLREYIVDEFQVEVPKSLRPYVSWEEFAADYYDSINAIPEYLSTYIFNENTFYVLNLEDYV